VESLPAGAIVVSTTGMTSRELFELRETRKEGHIMDFLTVGSMGHSSQIALGIALAKPDRQVYCLDGDGAVIMHMGSLAINATEAGANYKHIVLNNGSHDSVGGQPTVAHTIDICGAARACGYKTVLTAGSTDGILANLGLLKGAEGPALLEIRINKGHRKDLGRPTTTPQENKKAFMGYVQK
jgi:phosphonopyruvate decarboxylase